MASILRTTNGAYTRRCLVYASLVPLCVSVGYASYRGGYALMTLLFRP